jgi:hypothetical protein
MAGGPDYVAVLRNALENAPGAYAHPPSSGGDQISIRFPDSTAAIIEAIAAHCRQPDWNRNQVINALVDRGLFDLFCVLGDATMEEIMKAVASRIAPTFQPLAGLSDRLREFNRFRLYPSIQERKPGGLFGEVDITWTEARVDKQTGDLDLFGEGWKLHLHVTHLVDFIRDTERDAKDRFKNVYLELNVVVIKNGKQFGLTPRNPTLLEQRSRTTGRGARQRKP